MWTLGDVFVLRHAGFPFEWLEELGISGEVEAAIASLFEAEAALEMAAAGVSAGAGRATTEAIEHGRAPPAPHGPHAEWTRCYATWSSRSDEATEAFGSDLARLRRALVTRASDAQIQEAVFFSSPDVFENVWARFVAPSVACAREGAEQRRMERLAYSYMQRLCAKNETTSFFGPMGYGEIAGDDDAIEILPAGPRAHKTSLAYWAVEALAAAIACEHALWPALPIRANPLFVIDPDRQEARSEAADRVVALSHDQLRVLDAVTRSTAAAHLAEGLGESVAWVESVAMSLFVTGVLVRRLAFRSDRSDSAHELSDALAKLPECAARDRWTSRLARLEALRAQLEAAPFAEKRSILLTMDALFTELTGVSARRAGGRLYTDRLIVNDEASSPFRVRIGQRAASRLASALSPMLDRCASHGDAIREAASRAVVDAIGASATPIGFLDYATRLRALTVGPLAPKPNTNDEDRWSAEPSPTWDPHGGARFALPDLCLGRGADGDIHPVLSSVHHHLLTDGWLFTFHPDKARVAKSAEAWLDVHAAIPLAELATGRHNKGFYSFPGRRIAHAIAELRAEAAHPACVASATLRVTIEDGRPVLRGVDGERILLYLPLADLTLHPPFAALASAPVVFAPVSGDAHVPRVDVGGATYQRARWDVSASGLRNLSGFALFAAVQRTRRRLGLPRFVFARAPGERKPFLVDMACPFAIDLLKHFARDARAVTFEEMLPSPDELWLRDARGRYTFELRMQAQRSGRLTASGPDDVAPPEMRAVRAYATN